MRQRMVPVSPRFGINPVQLCCIDQRVDGSGTFGWMVGIGETANAVADDDAVSGVPSG
jgi:hypothetical protein